MNGMISVIVPVYKVEPYLRQCLDSILNQDYSALEVILIDDGSPDASGAICDAYAASDSRVRVIHQENGGGAAAKNAGLRIATGEYLSFVDSDDYLEPGAYSHMVALLRKHNADAVRCSFRDVYRTRTEEYAFPQGSAVVEGREYLRSFATDWTCGLLWNKLYKRCLFADTYFEEGHKIDDEYFTYLGIMNAEKVVFDDRVVYNYRRRGSSVMTSPASRRQLSLDRIDFMAKRRRVVNRRFPELRRDFDIAFLDALTYLPDHPDSTPESIRACRRQGLAYLFQGGNTIPPRYLLRGLLRLYLTPIGTLLTEAEKNRKPFVPEDYFP